MWFVNSQKDRKKLRSKDIEKRFCCTETQQPGVCSGCRVFNYNPGENSHLRFVLEKVKGSRTEIMAYGDLPFLHDLRPGEPQTVDASFALVRYRGKGSLPGPEEGTHECLSQLRWSGFGFFCQQHKNSSSIAFNNFRSGHVELVAMVIPLDQSEVPVTAAVTPSRGGPISRYELQPGNFNLEPEISVENWWPVTLPMDYGKHRGFMATHG